ncbi:hypothetical protein Ccel01_09090 [Cellulosimicrobium cellulans]|uniref:Uncharacterized protein n=1 Tax=Cellulosimicrobium cellulans TaxID=1710 RepID=A0AAV5P3N9_CELCE|nr:hypothetical protein Ccel01_09090 [Cellulosimicrobium cellulans]
MWTPAGLRADARLREPDHNVCASLSERVFRGVLDPWRHRELNPQTREKSRGPGPRREDRFNTLFDT